MSINTHTQPPILEGCAVLPPMHRGNGNGSPHRHQGDTSKAKGKPGRRNTGDRFAVLNAFVDAGMVGLSRVEALTWLVLYRDTRDGTACTSEEKIAARVGCSKRAVAEAVGRLRRRGLLVQVFKGGINRGPSRYRVVPTPKPLRH
jgi:biotin operon repressor